MRILVYFTYQHVLDEAKKAIGAQHRDALKNVIFENNPDVVSRRLEGLACSGEPFVLVCAYKLYPRIWGFTNGGDLAFALKNLNPKAYVVVLSIKPTGSFGSDEHIERGSLEEADLFVRLALLSMGRIKNLNSDRRPPVV